MRIRSSAWESMGFEPNLSLISVMLNHKSMSGFSSTGDKIERKLFGNRSENKHVCVFIFFNTLYEWSNKRMKKYRTKGVFSMDENNNRAPYVPIIQSSCTNNMLVLYKSNQFTKYSLKVILQ